MIAPMHREQPESADHHAQALRQRKMTISEQSGAHVERSGEVRGPKRGARTAAIQHFDFEVLVENQVAARADAREKIQCLAVTTHQYVLAIVDEIAALGIRE